MAVTIKWLQPSASVATGTEITSLDFGTIVRGNEATAQFKIGNTGNSAAEQVVVKAVGADEAVAWKTYSVSSGAYQGSLSVANIAANGITSAITAKTTVPSNAVLGNHVTATEVSYVYS